MAMKSLKNLLPVFVFLVMTSLQAQAIPCSKLTETPIVGGACCAGLKLNTTTNLCDDVIKDISLVSCLDDSDCSKLLPGQGMGCFGQTEDDFFTTPVTNPSQFISQSEKQDTVDDDRDKNVNENPLAVGAACIASSDCLSYACDAVAKTCLDKKICREAQMNETANVGVKCEEPLVRNILGKCDLSPADKQLYYLGLIPGDVNVKGNANRCDFNTNDDIRAKSLVSMKTLRAMEWLFATSSLDESQECLKVLPFMRDGMAKVFNDDRKKILTNFNILMAKIDLDNKLLQNARKDSEKLVIIHGKGIKEKDLATRKSSGYDAQIIMYRRSILFQNYEQAMSSIITTAYNKIAGLSENMGQWQDKAKNWKLGDKTWDASLAGKCRGKKAKKIYKRWTNFYQIKANSSENAAVLNSSLIKNYLSLVSGNSPEEVANSLQNGPQGTKFSTQFLIDPLMPGDKGSLSFSDFGTGSGNKRVLNTDAYPQMRTKFRERIVAFYKRMRGDNAPEQFVYEPELVSMEARNCIENPAGPKCELYNVFLDEMTDIALAQFIAYSTHSTNSYKKFFSSASNMRRKLFAKYETDMQNVTKYYESMSKGRDSQIACMEDSINQVVTQILDDGPGVIESKPVPATANSASGSGSDSRPGIVYTAAGVAGSSAASSITGSASGSGSSSSVINPTSLNGTNSSTQSLRVSETTRVSFSANLLSGTNAALSNLDTMGVSAPTSTAATGGTVAASALSAKAAALTNIKTSNTKAIALGVNIPAKEKEIQAALASVGQSNSGSSAGAGNSTENKSDSSSHFKSSGAASLSDEVKVEPKTQSAAVSVGQKSISAPGALTPAYQGQGLSESPRSQTSYKSSEAPTMSGEEHDVVMANYDRTKAEYRSDEEDPLFHKVSKAYVRNLEKILTRKKVEE
jgi:hypothetical protein